MISEGFLYDYQLYGLVGEENKPFGFFPLRDIADNMVLSPFFDIYTLLLSYVIFVYYFQKLQTAVS